MGGEELKWRQLKHNQLVSQQEPHFSPHSTVKTNDKNKNLRKNGISDVVTDSVNSEKTHMKKCMMIMIIIIIIMNKSQETTVFSGRQKLTSAMKLRPEK